VTGGCELVDQAFGDGASLEHYTLCRCGASKNKPFCDGEHKRTGFKDDQG
jgi:CDGSH-type Zn-finger protein